MSSPNTQTAPYNAIHRAANAFVRRQPSDVVGAHMELRRAVHAFASGGWADLDAARVQEMLALPDGDRAAMEAATRQMRGLLEAVWPAGPEDYDRHARFVPRIGEAAVLAGERLVAMRMAGQSEDRVAHVAAVLTELILNAHFAGRIQQMAILRSRSVEDLAPATAAAAIAHRQAVMGGAYAAAASALERFRFQEGTSLSASDLRSIAEGLLQGLKQADAHVVDVVNSYDVASRQAFLPTTVAPANAAEAVYRNVLGEDAMNPPDVRVNTLVAFAGSTRGGSTEARIEGSLDLFRSIVSVARIRRQQDGAVPSRHALLGTGIRGLSTLDAVVRNERFLHGVVEGRWREIEKEMRFMAQRNPKESPVVPLPGDMEALECMALYLQDMISQGFPIGRVLAEFRDSTHLTFGPSEEQFLLRICTYAARKYAANFACHSHPRFRETGRSGIRGEEVVRMLSGIEVELRERERMKDEELLDYGHARIIDLLEGGSLKRDEAETALEMLDDMITRVRAGQEVRYLTGLLALDGSVPADVIASYAGLPHTRRFALAASPTSKFYNLYARNGQPMREVQQDVYGRWMRYRQQAPAGRDVTPIQLRFSETRAGAAAPGTGKRMFRRGVSDFIVDVDSEVEEQQQARRSPDVEAHQPAENRQQSVGRKRRG